MLQIENLAVPGLRPVTFSLSDGECVAVRGPSGAGKTLLLRAIADLDPSSGSVRLDGIDRQAIPAPEWRRRVGYVPGEPGWWADRIGAHFEDWAAATPLVRRLGLPAEAASCQWRGPQPASGHGWRLFARSWPRRRCFSWTSQLQRSMPLPWRQPKR
jgi:phosphate-transporting ATPase